MNKQEIMEHTLGDLKCEWTHRTEPGKEAGWHIFNSKTLINIGDGQQAGINANEICRRCNNFDALVEVVTRMREHIRTEGDTMTDRELKLLERCEAALFDAGEIDQAGNKIA